MDQTDQSSAYEQAKSTAQQIFNTVSEQVQGTMDQVQQYMNGNETPINITVGDPIVKDSGFSKHTTYNIRGEDKNGQFDVFRRYSDFYELRETLLRKWPGCYIPPIPEKMLASGNDQEVVQLRKRLLTIFLNILSQLPHIYYSDDVNQIFLRSQSDVSKIYTSERAPTTSEIVDRFKISFPNLIVQDSNNSEYIMIISTFQGQLRKSMTYLKNYIEQGTQLALSRKKLQESKYQLYQQLLPHYERINLTEYVCGQEAKLVLANPQQAAEFNKMTEALNDLYRQLHNPMDHLTDLFRFELKDSESMQQCLNFRDQLISQRAKVEQKVREDQNELSKISAGKQTITTITNSVFNKNKDQAQVKVEQKIAEGQVEIEKLSELTNLVTSLIATSEIPLYRKNRVKFYHKVMIRMGEQECKLYQPENELLENIIQQCQVQQID